MTDPACFTDLEDQVASAMGEQQLDACPCLTGGSDRMCFVAGDLLFVDLVRRQQSCEATPARWRRCARYRINALRLLRRVG